GELESGTTDFIIEKRFKDHPLVAKQTKITLPKYLPPTKSKFVIFCEVYKDQIDPYRGVEVTDKSDLVKYLDRAVELRDRPIGERLRHCFNFLQSPDFDVSMDAYREFAKADYKDYSDMARALSPERIAGWLQDEKTPPYRYGLYASLLGHCGAS